MKTMSKTTHKVTAHTHTRNSTTNDRNQTKKETVLVFSEWNGTKRETEVFSIQN